MTYRFLILALSFVVIASSAFARDKKDLKAVEPQYDDDGNPTYYYKLNDELNERLADGDAEGIEIKHILYLKDETAEDAPLDNNVAGWMDFATYDGWRKYHEHCHVCHGPDGMGSSYAPALKDSLGSLGWDDFFEITINGRGQDEGAQAGNVMPSFGEDPNVVPYIENLYRYLKMRHDGKVRRGTRMPRLPKYKEPS